MKRKQFAGELIIGILRLLPAGSKPADLCQQHEISKATLYNWKPRCDGMQASDANRLKRPKEQNRRLKRLRLEAHHDLAALKVIVAGVLQSDARRCAIAHAMRAHDLSQRRTRRMLEMDPGTYRYRSQRPDDHAIRERLYAHAVTRRRFGYRPLGTRLAREGIAIKHKKLLRLSGNRPATDGLTAVAFG